MNRSFFLFAIGIFSILTIENTSAAEKYITGKVTHIGSAQIDGNVQVQISLRDVSLMDVASKLISSTTVSNPTTFPISYRIEYNPSDIEPGNVYAVSVRITGSDGKLLYINDVRTTAPLIETPSPNVDIAVIRVGSPPGSDTSKVVAPKACPLVKCAGPKICPYGYQKKDGCESCECNDPCNPSGKTKVCPTGQRCAVNKKSDGTFEARCDVTTKKYIDQKDTQGFNKTDCNLPKVVGPCRAAIPRFFYNPAVKCCEQFTYGGCQGNANNFATKAACQAACKVQ